jgi:hypothetical protein
VYLFNTAHTARRDSFAANAADMLFCRCTIDIDQLVLKALMIPFTVFTDGV